MSPDEILEDLNKIGVKLSRSSLMRYENQDLIPKPARGGGGPGGRFTDYPYETVYEARAAWALLHGKYSDKHLESLFAGNCPSIAPDAVKKIRAEVYNSGILDDPDIYEMGLRAPAFVKHNEKLIKEFTSQFGPGYAHFFTSLMLVWIDERNNARAMADFLEPYVE